MAHEGFLEYCMAVDPTYQPSWFHELLTSILQRVFERVMRGEKVRLIIMVPPRHGKSRTATVLFPSWVLGLAPYLPIITSSYSAELAEKFGSDTRDLMNDEVYRKIFDTRLRIDTAAKGNWMTTRNGTYFAAGVGGGITGRGFKLGIIDDPFKNRQEADSEVTREMVWNWYNSTFYTRQEGRSAIICIATRWHLDDLIGRLLAEQEDAEAAGLPFYDKWEVVKFPAIAEADEYFGGKLLRTRGQPLWPEKFGLPELEVFKNKDIYEWSSLYQQDPILSANAEFKEEWFNYYTEEELKGKNLYYTTTVDLAIAEGNRADSTVVMTVAKEADSPFWYVVEYTSGQLDPLQTIDAIFMHHEKYRSDVWLETVQYQKSLMYFMEEEMKKKKVYFTINELKKNNSVNKKTRIRGLVPMFKTGVILIRQNMIELKRELLQFPKGKHDDHPDALASQLEVQDNTIEKQKQDRDDEDDKDFDPHSMIN